MRNIFRIFWRDARRVSSNVVALVLVMGLSILPSLYAWFNIFSNWDPYGPESTSNIKIAVASDDEGVAIADASISIGEKVVEALRENDTIGWVFTDTSDEAVDGVYSGEYYAALVIPEKFTEEMIKFLGGEVGSPDIVYYENSKKNAIAPKITQKAETAVQEQLNSTFVSTLAEAAMQLGGLLADAEDGEGRLSDAVLSRFRDLESDLDSYVGLLGSFLGIMDSAKSIIDTSLAMLPGIDGMVESGQESMSGMEDMLISGDATIDSVTGMVSYSLGMVKGSLDSVKERISGDLQDLERYGQGITAGSGGIDAIFPYLEQLFNSAVEPWEESASGDVKDSIAAIRLQLGTIALDLSALRDGAGQTGADVTALRDSISAEVDSCRAAIEGLESDFTLTVKPKLDQTISDMQGSLSDTMSILTGLDADFGGVSDALGGYSLTLETGSKSLSDSLAMAKELQEGIRSLADGFEDVVKDPKYQELLDILETDPALLGDFVASPVTLETVGVYEVENYGSAMAPFYTILALWVGALILVAIIHVDVEPMEGVGEIKPYQAFFGRYITFFLIGQAQTLITVLGDLFYIRIQCRSPFLFYLAGAVASAVFTLFIYSLTVAFGNLGEALAVIILVVQVAGAGGTFPIETLPKVYQAIYRFLPFPYGMNAMRETIGGLYKMDYWVDLARLGGFALVSLFIGLVLAIPFRRLNELIKASKERSGVMV